MVGPLELRLPSSWTRIDAITFGSRRSFSDIPALSEIRGFVHNFVVHHSPVEPSTTLADLLVGYDQELASPLLGQLHTISRRDRTVAHGLSSHEHIFTFEHLELSVAVQQAHVLFVAESTRFMLTFTSLPGFFDDDRRAFDEVLETLCIHTEAA